MTDLSITAHSFFYVIIIPAIIILDRDHHIIKSSKFNDLDFVFTTLGDIPPHGPLALVWSALHQMALSDDPKSQVIVKKCGNKSLELRVFPYITACLQMEPFCGKNVRLFSLFFCVFSQINNMCCLCVCNFAKTMKVFKRRLYLFQYFISYRYKSWIFKTWI